MIYRETHYRCECDECGNIWRTRQEKLPKFCTSCHSPRWNRKFLGSDPTPIEESSSVVYETEIDWGA